MRRLPHAALLSVSVLTSACATTPEPSPLVPTAPATAPVVEVPPVEEPPAPSEEPAETRSVLARVLAEHPEIDLISAMGDEPRVMRVRDAAGSTICAWYEADEARLCFRDTRRIDNVWLVPMDDQDHAPLRVGVGPFDGVVEVLELDFERRTRKRIGEYPARPRVPDTAAFWMGSDTNTTILGRFRRAARPVPEAVEVFPAPDFVRALADADATVRVISAPVPALANEDASELCLRSADRWRCGDLFVAEDELESFVERVEPFGDGRFLAQRSMRLDGGNGDGSGAHGTAMLYVLTVEEEALRVLGWIPLGAMMWETQNLCAERDDSCFFRSVDRAYRAWTVDASACITFTRVTAESLYTGYEFVREPRAGGRARPVLALRPGDAEELLEAAFSEQPGEPLLTPLTLDAPASYRFEDELTRVGRCGAR